jgi:hypothetical protein
MMIFFRIKENLQRITQYNRAVAVCLQDFKFGLL